MSKLFVIFFVVVAFYGVQCDPVPQGLENFFKNFPKFNAQNFEKEIAASIQDMGSLQPDKLGDGVNGIATSIYSHNGHGRITVNENGKTYEKTFRK